MYKIRQVYVAAGATETLSLDYDHKPSELYFWAFPDSQISVETGTVESWIGAGKCVNASDGNYRFSGAFTCGYTIFVARKSIVASEPKQEIGAPFPLASLISAIKEIAVCIENDAEETLRAMRSPEPDGKMILPMREKRKDRVLGFDAYGNPVVGIDNIKELKEAFENFKILYDDLVKLVDDALAEWRAGIEEMRQIKESLSAEFQAGMKRIEELKAELDIVMKRCEEVLTEILKYRYRVVSREAYNNIVELEQIEKDVIYFVKGNREFSEIFEDLYNKTGELSEAIEKLRVDTENTAAVLLQRIEAGEQALAALEQKHETDKAEQSAALEAAKTELNAKISKNGEDIKSLAEGLGEFVTEIVDSAVAASEERCADRARQVAEETTAAAIQEEATIRKNTDDSLSGEIASLSGEMRTFSGLQLSQEEKISALETKTEDLETATEQLSEETSMFWQAINDVNRDFGKSLAALSTIVDEKASLLETVPAAGTSNADAYGYIGTLRDLGAFGGAVDVRQLTVYRRTEGTQANGGVALWARILKNVGGAWVIAAQSTHSLKWNDCAYAVSFKMEPVAGVVPPSADEKIAIVFVNSETAAASTSNGAVSFRVVSGSGGFSSALNADANAAEANTNWQPITTLWFAPLPGAEECATKGDIEDLKTGNTYLLQRISALETQILDLTDSLSVAEDAIADLSERLSALENANTETTSE